MSVRLTLDEEFRFEVGEEEEAIERAWERIFAEGSYGTEIRELDDDAPDVEPYVKPPPG